MQPSNATPRCFQSVARFLSVLCLLGAGLVLGQPATVDSRPLKVGISPVFPPMEDRGGYVLGFPQPLPGAVGVLKATTGEFLVQREFPKAKRRTYSSPEQAVTALKKKKIALFISDSTLVWYLAGLYGGEGLSNVPMLLTEEPLGWAVRRDDEALLKGANAFIDRAIKDGSLIKVFRKWGGTGE